VTGLTYAEALDGAICFGWIDARRPRSTSASGCSGSRRGGRAAAGRRSTARVPTSSPGPGECAPPGRPGRAAKLDGRWEAAYAGQRTALYRGPGRRAAGSPVASEFFATLDSANRYAILYRIDEAKRPLTRARRIERFVAMLAARETIHP